jgi:hypothetical protein
VKRLTVNRFTDAGLERLTVNRFTDRARRAVDPVREIRDE